MIEQATDITVIGAALAMAGKMILDYVKTSKNGNNGHSKCHEHAVVVESVHKTNQISDIVIELKTIAAETKSEVKQTNNYCEQLFDRMRVAEKDIAVLDKTKAEKTELNS